MKNVWIDDCKKGDRVTDSLHTGTIKKVTKNWYEIELDNGDIVKTARNGHTFKDPREH